jgi:hypothetical protein
MDRREIFLKKALFLQGSRKLRPLISEENVSFLASPGYEVASIGGMSRGD